MWYRGLYHILPGCITFCSGQVNDKSRVENKNMCSLSVLLWPWRLSWNTSLWISHHLHIVESVLIASQLREAHTQHPYRAEHAPTVQRKWKMNSIFSWNALHIYTDGKAVLLQSIERICPQFMHLPDNRKIIYMLIGTRDITMAVAELIHKNSK